MSNISMIQKYARDLKSWVSCKRTCQFNSGPGHQPLEIDYQIIAANLYQIRVCRVFIANLQVQFNQILGEVPFAQTPGKDPGLPAN